MWHDVGIGPKAIPCVLSTYTAALAAGGLVFLAGFVVQTVSYRREKRGRIVSAPRRTTTTTYYVQSAPVQQAPPPPPPPPPEAQGLC